MYEGQADEHRTQKIEARCNALSEIVRALTFRIHCDDKHQAPFDDCDFRTCKMARAVKDER